MTKMKVLDLFSGIGGFSLGLERAGMETVAFCEIDKKAQLVLQKHWPDVPIFSDIKKLRGDQLYGTIDVICGGFPCQDISTAGKGAGISGSRSGLWYEFQRLINEIRPKYAIIENVSALRSRGLDEVLRSLVEIGYDAEWYCIPASAVGAPHLRDRVWIIGYPSNQPGLQAHSLSDSLRESRETWKELGRRYWGQIPRVRRSIPESLSIGMDDGVPYRVDRLKQLGNAVVPQIPELIGRAIINYEQNCS